VEALGGGTLADIHRLTRHVRMSRVTEGRPVISTGRAEGQKRMVLRPAHPRPARHGPGMARVELECGQGLSSDVMECG
jgi:hypothetical protein